MNERAVRLGWRDLLASDYGALYCSPGESRHRRALLWLPRLITNPSMHATILTRLLIASPRAIGWVWRNLLIAKHGIDVHRNVSIGPGLVLPHPVGIIIGEGVEIGRNVTLFHCVTLGVRRLPKAAESRAEPPPAPVIGDGVVVYTQSIIVGGVTVDARAVVGANTFVDHDVAAGTTLRRGEGVRPDAGRSDPEAQQSA